MEVVVYHTNWSTYGRNFQVKDLPMDAITTLSYAFFNLSEVRPGEWEIVSGDTYSDFDKRFTGSDSVQPPDSWNETAPYYGNFGQLRKLRQQGKSFKLDLAIGGWTWSKNFSDAVLTAKSRSSLCSSIIALFKRIDLFTGVSVDWEYPSNDGVNYGNGGNVARPEDADNLCLFLKELRAAFAANGMSKHTIAICMVAAPEKMKVSLAKIHPLVDSIHLMTYDFWDGNW